MSASNKSFELTVQLQSHLSPFIDYSLFDREKINATYVTQMHFLAYIGAEKWLVSGQYVVTPSSTEIDADWIGSPSTLRVSTIMTFCRLVPLHDRRNSGRL